MSIPFAAHPCVGPGALLEGNDGSEGALIWVSRSRVDSGTLRIRTAEERDTADHARVVIRYLTGNVPHGLALDSGSVRLRDSAGVQSGAVAGRGLEIPGAVRVVVEGVFFGVLPGSDTVPCTSPEAS